MARTAADRPTPVAAVDLGGTYLRTAVVIGDRIVGRRRWPSEVERGADDVVERCALALSESIEEHLAAGGETPAAAGVSAPGPLDPVRGLLYDPPNLGPSFHGLRLAEQLSQRLGMAVHLDRDTQLAALGEGRYGAARDLDDFVYLTVSTGIGGAVVSEGRLMRGVRGLAGELGHLTVDFRGPPCGCGAQGHLEAYSSGTGITRRAGDALAAGRPSAALERLASHGALSAAAVAAAEAVGDPLAVEIMRDARQAFAAAMVTIVDVFAPQRVVVGGGVAMGQGERLLGPAREAVARLAFRAQAAEVEIVPAALGDDVGLLGASALVDERVGRT
jgi:glucokinase